MLRLRHDCFKDIVSGIASVPDLELNSDAFSDRVERLKSLCNKWVQREWVAEAEVQQVFGASTHSILDAVNATTLVFSQVRRSRAGVLVRAGLILFPAALRSPFSCAGW